jgi:hypothetical protein
MTLQDWFEQYLPQPKEREVALGELQRLGQEWDAAEPVDMIEVEGWGGKMPDPLKNAHMMGWIPK